VPAGLGDDGLRVLAEWEPQRPELGRASLVVALAGGGRWQYELHLEATDPEPDDVLYLEAPMGKRSGVGFRLASPTENRVAFTASFTPETPTCFTVTPLSGKLSPAAEADGGTLFTVRYAPTQYGRVTQGTLLISTGVMQWTFAVRGSHPTYNVPRPLRARVDTTISKEVASNLSGLGLKRKPRKLL
jgi:hypothetical protein